MVKGSQPDNLSNKVPIEPVSKLLAHQKIATTQEYEQVLDHKIRENSEREVKQW